MTDDRRPFLCRGPGPKNCASCGRWIIRRSLVINAVGAVVKGVVGIMCASQALIADAMQSLADVVVFAVNYSGHCGPRRVLMLGGVFIAALTFLSGVWILAENTAILTVGEHARPGLLAVLVAGGGALSNWYCYRLARCAYARRRDPGLLVCTIQNRTNCLASLLATVGLLLAELGLVRCDPIFAIAIGFFLFASAIEMFQWAARELPAAGNVKRLTPVAVLVIATCLVTCSVQSARGRDNVILVPAQGSSPGSQVDRVLGRSHSFLVFDTTSDTVTPIVNYSRHLSSDLSDVLLRIVRQHDVDVVLAEKIGVEMYDDLGAAGVRMYYVDGRASARRTVEAYLAGKFARARAANAARGAGRRNVRWLEPW